MSAAGAVATRTAPGPVRVGDPGVLDLRFRRAPEGDTVLAARRQRFPLRVTTPFHLDPAAPEMAWIYVQNPTGAVFGGDRLDLRIVAEQDAWVHLTTQSATKICRAEDQAPARQRLRLALGRGAYVESLPDTLIPQAGSRYRQDTEIDLEPGSMCVVAETVAPGRRAFGERFAFDRLELRTTVRAGGRELCAEHLCFEPGRASPQRAGILGDGDYLVTLMALAPDRDADELASGIDRGLRALEDRGGGVRAAAGTLPHGAGARAIAVAADAPLAVEARGVAWAAAREVLLGLPVPKERK